MSPSASSRSWVGVTVPSEDLNISPAASGIIEMMLVEEGRTVRKGDVLFRLEAKLEKLEVARLKAVAESKAGVLEAEARLVQAENEERRYRDLHAKGIAADPEFDDRMREANVARIRLNQARVTHDVDVFRYETAVARLEQRTVRSPIDGYVAERMYSRGEAVEDLEPVLRLVSLDPLWAEFDCPQEDARFFVTGAKVHAVRSSDSSEEVEARVVFASKSVDPASQTFRVRLELIDAEDWKAGSKVIIAIESR